MVNETLVGFLKENPGSGKEDIIAATSLSGLFLFNILRSHVRKRLLVATEENGITTYSVNEAEFNEIIGEQTARDNNVEGNEGQPVEKNPKEAKALPKNEEAEGFNLKSNGRDDTKFVFNNESYGKGPLVRAVVSKFVGDHPDITFEKLKEVFPDTLMKRFGVFALEQEARKLSAKRGRYFLKDEQLIKIDDGKETIAVCNQWTTALIRPFLTVAKQVGYLITQ